MSESTNQAENEAKIKQWGQEAYQKATQFLADEGIVTDSVATEHSRYLAPLVAVWKVKSITGKWYWVISGDLPTDYIAEDAAQTPREALRSFSLRWQVKAENIRAEAEDNEEKLKQAGVLAGRAEGLYQIVERDDLWG